REHGGDLHPPSTELTFGDDEHGGLVAFDLGPALTSRALRERLATFVRTHTLGDFGQIRFVRWLREPGGGTRFLTLWTDHRFSLDGLIPPRGKDVDGGDVPGVPRPAGMTRVLAIEESGKPYLLRVYEGRGTAKQVAAELSLALQQRGWA